MAYLQSICVLLVAALVNRSDEAAPTFDAFDPIAAANCTALYGISGFLNPICLDNIHGFFPCIYNIGNEDTVGFAAVDFGNGTGAIGIKFRFSCGKPANFRSQVNFFLDSADDGVPFHTMTLGTTYSNKNWITVKQYLDYSPVAIGIHDVYLKFEADINDGYMAVASIQFF